MKPISKRNSLEEIDRNVRASIPVGVDARLAEAYFRANRVEHSNAVRERIVYGIVRGIRGSWLLVEVSAWIRIHYDPHSRVTRIDVSRVNTSF
ncbi:hypothetical protein CSW64_10375 [Caulobacter mirabilis]|uniref:Uncharacterized protein n=1 Tax=Caulobacter mirabilis TaxID=69666 RepID=A0A2D2AXP7_9CAUL|nr:hypothetical protein CSW64_10375 [Caulobacter mirabilis]